MHYYPSRWKQSPHSPTNFVGSCPGLGGRASEDRVEVQNKQRRYAQVQKGAEGVGRGVQLSQFLWSIIASAAHFVFPLHVFDCLYQYIVLGLLT